MKVTKTWILSSAVALALLPASSTLAAAAEEVRWAAFVGNIRTGAAGAVGSGTGAVNAAGAPWVATGGNARVNLASEDLRFRIEGLVLADTIFVGTPGNNPEVVGTLVCDTDGSVAVRSGAQGSSPVVITIHLECKVKFKGSNCRRGARAIIARQRAF